MFFEGSEKKFELSVNSEVSSLRQLPKSFWAECVALSQAQIISQVSSKECDAYLLSESSLFVWKDRVTMITCGTTNLCQAAMFLLNHFGVDKVGSFFYERKNEYFPRHQTSDFFDDIQCLQKILPGQAYRLGEANEHHLYLFHLDRPYEAPQTDRTIELLMYGLSGQAKELFTKENCQPEQIRKFLNLDKIFKDFLFDDFVFSPVGYSCNAVKGSDYYTIHVTPQDVGPYVSFEANIKNLDSQYIVESIVNIFKPKSFDVIQFDSQDVKDVNFEGFRKINAVEDQLGGYNVLFKSYYEPKVNYQKAEKLEI